MENQGESYGGKRCVMGCHHESIREPGRQPITFFLYNPDCLQHGCMEIVEIRRADLRAKVERYMEAI